MKSKDFNPGQFIGKGKGYTMADLENDRKEFGYPRVVTAYAESAAGPGWGNSPLWVVMEDLDPDSPNGKRMYIECIQPEDQTKEIRLLYLISNQIHFVMSGEAGKILAERRKRQLASTRAAARRGKT